ncbi:MAG: hypothetical protein EAZ26_10920 [Runella slithyformis]|nr:MAG: hypothetical protein EAZ26_10920 [Runella slithyformis]
MRLLYTLILISQADRFFRRFANAALQRSFRKPIAEWRLIKLYIQLKVREKIMQHSLHITSFLIALNHAWHQ